MNDLRSIDFRNVPLGDVCDIQKVSFGSKTGHLFEDTDEIELEPIPLEQPQIDSQAWIRENTPPSRFFNRFQAAQQSQILMKNEVVHVHGIHSYTETFKHKLYIKSTSVKKDPNPANAKQPFRSAFNKQQAPLMNGKVPMGATQLSSIAEVNSVGEMDI